MKGTLTSNVGGRDQRVMVFTLDCGEDLHRPRPRMGHQFDHFLLCCCTLVVHIVRARIDRSGMVVMLVQNLQLSVLAVLHFKDS